MEDDEEDPSAAVDLNGSDTLPALAQSTNPLFPNAIVKRPTHTHGKAAPKTSSKPSAAAVAEEKEKEKEEKEKERERERKANQSVGPSPQTKPYGAKYTPVSPSLFPPPLSHGNDQE